MTKNIISVAVCAVLLSGCSWFDDWSPWSSENSGLEPPSTLMTAHAPQQSSVMGGAPYVPTPLAVNRSRTEAELMARVDGLEDALEDMQKTLDSMLPAIASLASLDADLKARLSEISPASGTPAAVIDSVHSDIQRRQDVRERVEQESSNTALTPIFRPSRITEGVGFERNVKNVRVGMHSDKTRLVLDVNGTPDFSYALNDQGDVLAIDLKGTGWEAGSALTGIRSPLIVSYSVQKLGEQGTRLLLKLKNPINVLWADKLAPNSKYGDRIVLDLAGV
jgi:hypothetical protein